MAGAISKFLYASADKLGVERRLFDRGLYLMVFVAYVYKVIYPTLRKAWTAKKGLDGGRAGERRGPAVNREFLDRLAFLLKIMIPGAMSLEALILAAHTSTLVARTFLSIYVAVLEGSMVKHIVRKDVASFGRSMLRWIAVAVPATFTNSAIRYLERHLALAFRTRLAERARAMYFQGQTYYRVSNMDSRLVNADHSLTEDVEAFSSSVAHLYSHVSKPLLDVALITFQLYRVSKQTCGEVTSMVPFSWAGNKKRIPCWVP